MSFSDLGRHLAAALIAGLALGAGARIVMRLIAWSSGMPGAFSAGGSFEVVLFGALIGAPVALLLLAVRSRITIRPPWPGLIAGGAVFAVLAEWPPESARSAMLATNDPPLLTAGSFLVLFLLFGAGLEWWWVQTTGSYRSRTSSR